MAKRYSGSVEMTITFREAAWSRNLGGWTRDRYHIVLKNVETGWRRTMEIRPPNLLEEALDSQAAYDSVARAALAFAEPIDGVEFNNYAYAVYRTPRPVTVGGISVVPCRRHPRCRKNRKAAIQCALVQHDERLERKR